MKDVNWPECCWSAEPRSVRTKSWRPSAPAAWVTVYRARDERLSRDVALKMISHDAVGSASSRRRFEIEARTLAGISHANLVAVYDVGADSERPFLITELIDGESLRQILKKTRLPNKKALNIAVQMAAGLTAAHESGIVHRDLKPENVMVTRDGTVKLIDFGLAKHTAAKSSSGDDTESIVTEPGVVLGTAGYMSPEQAAGSPVDFRSDQFAFGAILYELFTGDKAFSGKTTLEILTALIHADPPRLSKEGLGVSAPVLWIVKRCLAKDPAGRYAATRDLYLDLETAGAESDSIKAVPQRRSLRWMGVMLAIAAGVATAFLIGLRHAPEVPPKLTPLATDASVESEPRWAPDGRTLLFLREVSGVLQIFTRSAGAAGAAQITRSARNCSFPFWSADGALIYYMSEGDLWSVSSSGGQPQKVEATVRAPAASPDGKQLAFFRGQINTYTLWLRPASGAAPQRYSRRPFSRPVWVVQQSAFSPDSRKLAVLWSASGSPSQEPALWIVPLSGGEPYNVPLPPGIGIVGTGLAWMPDNLSILFSSYLPDSFGTHVVVLNTRTGDIRRLTEGIGNETHPHISNDGSRLAFTSGGTDLDLLEFSASGDGKQRPLLATSFSEEGPAWNPDGESYAFSRTGTGGRSKLYTRGARDGWERPLLDPESHDDPHSYYRPKFSPDGQRLVYERYGGEGHIAHVSFVAGSRPSRIDKECDDQHGPVWSPDGQWIAYRRQRNGVWEVARVRSDGSGSPVTITNESVAVGGGSSLDWSFGGDWLAYSGPQGLRLVSSDGRMNRVLMSPAPSAFGFARDGKQIYGLNRGQNNTWRVVAIDLAKGAATDINVIEFPPMTTVSGFAVHPNGTSFVTAVGTSRYDIWMRDGLNQPRSWWASLFRRSAH